MKLGHAVAAFLSLLAFYLLSSGPVFAVTRHVVTWDDQGNVTRNAGFCNAVTTIYAPILWFDRSEAAFDQILGRYVEICDVINH